MRASSILHVIPAIAPRYGGPSEAALGMCRAIRRAGASTLIATTDADGTGHLPVPTDQAVTYQELPAIFFRRQISESFKWSAPLGRWLRTHVRDFDLVHIHAVFSHSSLAAGRACRAAGVPYIVRPLGTLDPWSLDRHHWRKRLLLALGVRRLLTAASAVHYTSAQEQRLAEQRLPWLTRGAVVPLGVDDGLFEPAAGMRREPVVLFLGRLDPKKGVDVLIHAFETLISDTACSHWRLIIAGDGDAGYVDSLRRLCQRGPAGNRIELGGWVARDDRRRLLHSSRLFVLPSQQENFGIALVEAMASGLPVVVSPGVNLSHDIIAAGAGWLCARDSVALAATLREAMTSGRTLDQYAARARRFADRFRWPAVGEGLMSLYDNVLGARACVARELDAARPA